MSGYSDCPSGETCYQSEIDCNEPQPVAAETQAPTTTMIEPTESSSSSMVDINDIGIDNANEDWDSESQSDPSNIDNHNEAWDTEQAKIDNEGEDWGSHSDTIVDNSGEDWDKPEQTQKPNPRTPTSEPTTEPTIDLLGRLEDLKETMYCK